MPFLKIRSMLLAGAGVFSLLGLTHQTAMAQNQPQPENSPAIIPRVKSIQSNSKQGMPIPQCWKVHAPGESLPALLEVLQAWGLKAEACTQPEQAHIVLDIAQPKANPQLQPAKQQAYSMDINGTRVKIQTPSHAGAVHALSGLFQLQRQYAAQKKLPALSISDKPELAWRGMMIDSCRSFFTPEELRGMLDIMALHKLNLLHWHLSDDQAWRIEIKKHPKLCLVGSKRDSSPLIGDRNKSDNTPYGPYFYTQQQVRELVDYAAKRGICIVPEIEMPGHASAAIAAYPELGNSDIKDYDPKVACSWGVFNYTFAPAPQTFKFLEEVLSEVSALFPSEFVHIGGDEAPKDQWKNSAKAQAYMREHNIADEHALQSHFVSKVEQILKKQGKRLLGWDEIEEGGLHKDAVVMFWRSWNKDGVQRILANGNQLVMATNTGLYLDYGQHPPGKANLQGEKLKEYENIGQFLPLEQVYAYQAVPANLPQDSKERILGMQTQCWSEYMFNYPKWQYQALPRLAAVAEVAWSGNEGRNYEQFLQRLEHMYAIYRDWQLNYCTPDGSPAKPQLKITRQPSAQEAK